MALGNEREWIQHVNVTIALATCFCNNCVVCCILRPLYLQWENPRDERHLEKETENDGEDYEKEFWGLE